MRLQNEFIAENDAAEINTLVHKVLNDLGKPEPPLSLDDVRELLKLDRQYYRSSDTGILIETAHRMKLAGKQVFARPSRIIDAVKQWDLKALWVPDGRRILIDVDEPKPKHRWAEAHEVGHSLIPWHEPFMHGDQRVTLSVACHEQLEAQANYAAARLLFLGDAFAERLLSGDVNFDRVKHLGREVFHNTMTTSLWRAVEAIDAPALGLVSCHPCEQDTDEPVRYFLRSRRFAERFGNVSALSVFRAMREFCFGSRGPIGSNEVVLKDDIGQDHVFFLECFNNSYDTLTLGVHRGKRTVQVIATKDE